MRRPIVDVVVTDLDNTLYDWFEFWHKSFGALLARLAEESGVPREVLLREIKLVHERHQTSEYAFLIQELPSLQRLHPGGDLVRIYDEAIHEYRRARKAHLRLYPGVQQTLEILKREGTLLVGYTESMAFYSASRVRALGLDGILDYLYSPADHSLPPGLRREEIRMYPSERYGLERTEHRFTPPGEVKPNPEVLLDILAEVGGSLETSLYVGDSLLKDVLMAQEAGVADVYARYGTAHAREEYELLRAVTHWTQAQVEREKLASSRTVRPTFTLEESFGEILDLFQPVAFDRPALVRARL
jgi:phosphoglycolate phosphatase-like HAD superfamily hydrolase